MQGFNASKRNDAGNCYILALVSCAIVAATFWNVPVGIWGGGDAVWQIRALQQYVSGDSSSVNHLTMPDNRDLSQDSSLWIAWWSPGTNVVSYPLLLTGLSLGMSIRLVTIAALLIGSFGWIRYATMFEIPKLFLAFFSIGLPWFHYAAKNLFSYSAEALLFASVPWVLVATHNLSLLHLAGLQGTHGKHEPHKHILQCFLLGLAAGALYILKYSGAYIALSILVFSIINVYLFYKNIRKTTLNNNFFNLFSLVFLTAGIIIPIFALSLANWKLGRFVNLVVHVRRFNFEMDWLLYAFTNPLVITGNLVSLAHGVTSWLAGVSSSPIANSSVLWGYPFDKVFLAAAFAVPGTSVMVFAVFRELRRNLLPRYLLTGSVFFVSAFCLLITWTFSSAVSLEPRHVASAGLAIIPFGIEVFCAALRNLSGRNFFIKVLYSLFPFYALVGILTSIVFVAKVKVDFNGRPVMGASEIYDVLDRNGNIGIDFKLVTEGFDKTFDIWYVPEPRVALDLPGRCIITMLRRNSGTFLNNHGTDVYCSSKNFRIRVLLPRSQKEELRKVILASFPQVKDWSLAASGESDYELWLGSLDSGGEAGWMECMQRRIVPFSVR